MDPEVRSGVMGHKNVEAQEVYDKAIPGGHPGRAQLSGQAVAIKMWYKIRPFSEKTDAN